MPIRRHAARHSIAVLLSLAPLMAAAQAAPPVAPPTEGVLTLSASATVEVPQEDRKSVV